ncbi:hypothetical protein CIB84_006975 [Bambusicola thoracicus]|uniref:PHD-type domain-containing protein n=1 Tax=Bambusicola thoracicus TaxID=9083 RepID=A0A2P4SYV1_BAMTH|nr:hypothetical protein CIB84_006975 [Bambusicola thoracicus]
MMSSRKRKASSSEEPVCVLCGRADVDPDVCGHRLYEKGIRVHQFCLEFAITFTEGSLIRLATEGLPLGAIKRAVKHAAKQQCFVCGERGAAITCTERGCERSFHLPCAMDGECVNQHFGQRRGYCWEHRPRQEIQEAPGEGNNCLICLEPVGDSLSYHTMMCPACQHAWFHRGCIQQLVLTAGDYCFSCPGCRNQDEFLQEMATMGIQIPHRPWELILCSSCAAQGTHRQCSHLSNTTHTWDCNSCAGLGTGARTPWEQTSQAARKKPHQKPLPAARPGPQFPEPAKRTPRQEVNASLKGAERHPQINKICHFDVPKGFQSARTQGKDLAGRAGLQSKFSSRE